MWWKLKKKSDDGDMIIYQYSCETDLLDGEVAYSRTKQTFTCLQLASGDTERGVQRFFPHLWRTIDKEGAPNEHFIAIG
ncbi:hypothetical protein P9B03_08565 [Metasolibacillus meyeri]|uniref:Uncharacterized protein n=1 Tax=Metasolibacillus meyeri TaxID=1071052 RepID=A0AAW9NU52_9BACL|nr:hypothetical protein [Metasolibacillus meyeri]MEC1178531.1 hypothetical protein [Metasolibacillus meyeri]